MGVKIVFISIIFFGVIACLYSCGDLFAHKKRITDNYYLVESDIKDNLSICFRTSDGDYIGRIPAKVIEYGFTDSFIVSKNKTNDGIRFYIVNRNKDSDYAEQNDFLIGPLTEKEYDSIKASMNLHIELAKI